MHKLRNLLGGVPPPYRNDYVTWGVPPSPPVTTTVIFFGRVLFSVTLGVPPSPKSYVVVTVGGGTPPKRLRSLCMIP